MTITFTEQYTFEHERQGWAKGVWDSELDKAVWVDKGTGLDCMIARNGYGTWCGYVAVKEGHKFFGVDYSKIGGAFVHGGLTYSDSCQGHICHLDDEGQHVWWFGFDCNHSMDGSPIPSEWRKGEYRTQSYVIQQVEKLAKGVEKWQIITWDDDDY